MARRKKKTSKEKGKKAASSSQPKDYSKAYSVERFWSKLRTNSADAGRDVIEKALWLYYALENPATPVRAKATIIAALGYFVLLIDAIPDFTPVVGYADDLGVIAAAVATVAMNINADVKAKARAKLKDWFG
jgi:uncharacterized membrane protein YkvA (DUF1232 family)